MKKELAVLVLGLIATSNVCCELIDLFMDYVVSSSNTWSNFFSWLFLSSSWLSFNSLYWLSYLAHIVSICLRICSTFFSKMSFISRSCVASLASASMTR